MAYTFDAASGESLSDLVEMFTSQSFSAARYGELAKRWLNDGVLEVCKRLQVMQGAAICDYAATGIVTQPASPFFVVHEVWMVHPNASGSTVAAISAAERCPLAPLPPDRRTFVGRGSAPCFYNAQRAGAVSGQGVPLQITIAPAVAAGRVGIVGLQRPPLMAMNADVTGLGADLDDAVVCWAKSRAFRNEDDAEMSGFWRSEFEAALRSGAMVGTDDGPVVTPGLED
jgi:hypothetical protein